MHLADAVIKGVLLGLFLAISVGPTLFAIIQYSLENSYKAGIAFVLGVSVSDISYVCIANGAAGWLENLRVYEKYIAYGGAAILIMAGASGFFQKKKPEKTSKEPVIIRKRDYFRIWLSGFLINTVNPGVIITWLAAVTATVSSPVSYRFALFGTCLGLILTIDFTKVFLANLIKKYLTPRRVLYLQRFSSICLLGIGVMLLVTTAMKG